MYCLLHNVEVHLGLHVILFKHLATRSLNQIFEESARTLQTFIVTETFEHHRAASLTLVGASTDFLHTIARCLEDMRCWFCLILAACGADSASAPVPAPPAAVAQPVVTAASPATPPPLSAAHGAEIAVLGVTLDGLAAATADRLGGIRLWPVLDGTREPVVIHGTAPRALALMRDGDGFAIGMLDAAGGVHVVRTTALGVVRGRATAKSEVAATDLTATAEGLLILRADQTVDLVDPSGAVRSHLTPEPGTRIDGLVARGGRVLALIAEGRQLHGRWIALDRGARWGGDTPKLPGPIERAVLSPGGQLLAAVRPRSLHPVLIDLASGAQRKVPLCVERRWPHQDGDGSIDENELLNSDGAPRPLGFTTDGTVVCSVMSQVIWWGTDGTVQRGAAGISLAGVQAPVATSGALIVGVGASLGFIAPDATWFLGYTAHDLSSLRVGATGALVGATDQQALVLDTGPGASLRERARFESGHTVSDVNALVPIDDRYAIGTLRLQRPGERQDAFQVAVVDGLTAVVHQILPYQAREPVVTYDPASRLLATSDGNLSLLLRYDPAAHVFGDPVRVGSSIAVGQLAILDPRLSRGVIALQISEHPDGRLVGELTEVDLRPGTTVRPNTYGVPGEFCAVDRAGKLYMRRPSDGNDVVVYARGLAVARLPGLARAALRPDPDGSWIAAFDGPRLTLMSSDGHVRWTTASWSVADAGWTASGELVVQFPTGLARVDLETGELLDRRCGWGFGRLDHAPDIRYTGPSICDAAR